MMPDNTPKPSAAPLRVPVSKKRKITEGALINTPIMVVFVLLMQYWFPNLLPGIRQAIVDVGVTDENTYNMIMLTIAGFVMSVITTMQSWARNVIHEAKNAWPILGRIFGVASALFFVFLFGCKTYTSITVNEFNDQQKIVKTTTITSEDYGRACMDAWIEADGKIWVTHQTDASSDWILGRVVSAIGPEVVAAFVSPFEMVISALSGRDQIESPSGLHGCGGIYQLDPPGESTEDLATETQ